MSQERDLEYFAANPSELTDADIKRLEALVNGDDPDTQAAKEEQAEAESTKQAEQSAAAGAKDDKAKEEQQQQAAAKTEEGQPNQQVIRSKDGKHEIPYGVLAEARDEARREREARQQLEQNVAAMQQQLDTLTRQAQGQRTTAAQREQAQDEVLSEEALAELEDTNPEMAKAFKALSAQVNQMRELVGGVQQSQQQAVQREQRTVQETVQEAIDANDTLRYWQAKDPAMWQAAINMDAVLKADPRNKALSMSDRFEKVVSAVQAAYGATELPEDFKPRKAAQAPAPAPAPAATTTKKAVEQALKDADKTPNVTTLSDIAGGTPPGNEAEELAALSAAELGSKFEKMTVAQMNQLIARLG